MRANLKVLSGPQFGKTVSFNSSQIWIVENPDGSLSFDELQPVSTNVKTGQLLHAGDGWYFEPVTSFPWYVDDVELAARRRVRVKSGAVIKLTFIGPKVQFSLGEAISLVPGNSSGLEDEPLKLAPLSEIPAPEQQAIAPTPSQPQVTKSQQEQEPVNSAIPTSSAIPVDGKLNLVSVGIIIAMCVIAGAAAIYVTSKDGSNSIAKSNLVTALEPVTPKQLYSDIVWIGTDDDEGLIPICSGVVIGKDRVAVAAACLDVLKQDEDVGWRVFSEALPGGSLKITEIVFPYDVEKSGAEQSRHKQFGYVKVNGRMNPKLKTANLADFPKPKQNTLRVCGYSCEQSASSNLYSSENRPDIEIFETKIKSIQDVEGIRRFLIEEIPPGFNGSAILDEQGRWCGSLYGKNIHAAEDVLLK